LPLEDLIQTTSMTCWEALPRFDPGRGNKPWTFLAPRAMGAMQDLCRETNRLDGGRRSRPAKPHASLDATCEVTGRGDKEVERHEPSDPRAARGQRRRESDDRFRALIKGLARIDRIIVTLFFQEDCTMKEIAGSLGLSESRVSQRMSQLLPRLAPAARHLYGWSERPAAARSTIRLAACRSKRRRVA
jgi:RNA polymerase sigma factor (sigma-70 family)